MAQSDLNDKINDLHNELNSVQPTPKTQAVVEDLKNEIHPIVSAPDADHSIHYKSLAERLNLALVDLEVDHPKISRAIQDVLDELAAVGI